MWMNVLGTLSNKRKLNIPWQRHTYLRRKCLDMPCFLTFTFNMTSTSIQLDFRSTSAATQILIKLPIYMHTCILSLIKRMSIYKTGVDSLNRKKQEVPFQRLWRAYISNRPRAGMSLTNKYNLDRFIWNWSVCPGSSLWLYEAMLFQLHQYERYSRVKTSCTNSQIVTNNLVRVHIMMK